MNNAYISEYLQLIKAQLPIYGKAEQAFVMQLTDTIELYFSDAQTAPESVSDVIHIFGSPQHVVDEHLSENVQDVAQHIRARRYVRTCLAAALIALVVVLATFIVSQIYWNSATQIVNDYEAPAYSDELSAESELESEF
ncbi:MAG: DUF6120 family protein [Clostridiales bacterium]|nr:DUF6120 family protein [Clostridiales bacterium]